MIKNNLFYNNICEFGCGLYFNHLGGSSIVMDSIFDLNSNPSHPTGSGSAILVAGDKRTNIVSIRNLFQNNTSYGTGIFGTYNSYITDINSTFFS